MKVKLVAAISLLLLISGCSLSRYRSAELSLDKKEYDKAIRKYLIMMQPHLRNGKRYIYYDREAVTGIGKVYWYMQKYETSAKILHMVNTKDPYFGKALFYLGMSLEGSGKESEAIQIYGKYSDIDPNDPYRQILMGRKDFMVRNQMARDVQASIQNEGQLSIDQFPENSIAVLYFLSLSENPEWQPFQKGMAEMVINDLSRIKQLQVIDRLKLNGIMDELGLRVSDLASDTLLNRLGFLLGARHLVKGSFMISENLQVTLDAGIYQTEGNELPTSVNFDGNLSRIFQMEKELVLRIIDYFKISLTIQQREDILQIPTENIAAFLSYCRGLDALDEENYDKAQQYFYQAIQSDSKFTIAENLLTSKKIWEATHNRNLYRVDHEVAQLIETTSKGQARLIYKPPPELVSNWNRLQRMALYQSVGLIPGNDTREPFQEAEFLGAPVLPIMLGEPPKPPIR